MCLGYGEYWLDKDPYNFDSEDEYWAFMNASEDTDEKKEGT